MLHFTSVSFRALNANYILSLENSTHLPVSSVPCKNPPWTLGIMFGLLQRRTGQSLFLPIIAPFEGDCSACRKPSVEGKAIYSF